MGTSATAPGCSLQKGTIVRFISWHTGMAATVSGLGLRYREATAPTSHFDRPKSHQTFSFRCTLDLKLTENYIACSMRFEYNKLRRSKPLMAERSNHISVMFFKLL